MIDVKQAVTRRKFIRAGAAGIGVAGMGAALVACGAESALGTGNQSVTASGASASSSSTQGAAATMAAGAVPDGTARLPLPGVAQPVGRRAPQVVPVELETREVVGLLDDGVAFHFWSFNGTVPGPMIRFRQDDTVELTLKNATDSTATRSIDLHGATGPGGGAAVTQVQPGDHATFRFKALNPGVYVYHCATATVPMDVSCGMYGLFVVEPLEGLPPVDHEFYVMQGDFYPAGSRGDKRLREFDMEKMLDECPEYLVFNGSSGALTGDKAPRAKTGETVRIFFGAGGVNVTSSFHVIGEIFDRVAREGASEWSTNIQTTHVPAGGATIVEFTVQAPGDYTLVDHSLGRVMKGASGILHVEGSENPEIFQAVG